MATETTCPHGGWKNMEQPNGDPGTCSCGQSGWLCGMCERDAADARTEKMVEGLALTGVLASPNIKPANIEDAARSAARHASALREREGGEG